MIPHISCIFFQYLKFCEFSGIILVPEFFFWNPLLQIVFFLLLYALRERIVSLL